MAAGRLAALRRSTARIGVRTLLVLVLLALVYFVARGYPQELIQRFGERGPAATLTDLTQVDQLQGLQSSGRDPSPHPAPLPHLIDVSCGCQLGTPGGLGQA